MTLSLHLTATRARLTAVFWLILVAGCGPQQAVKPVPPTPPPTAGADARLRNGDFLGAAAEFARLAESGDPAAASRYRMMAALAYIDGDDTASARALLQGPAPGDANAGQLYALALAASASPAAELDEAERQIEAVDSRSLTPYQRSIYYRTLGRISIAKQAYASAASAFVAADSSSLPASKRAELHNDTWLALSHMDSDAINAARSDASRRQIGWLDLVTATRPNLHNSAALAAAIEGWRGNHANHPANISFLEQLFELAESLSAQTRHIALLLPFHGAYAGAANAIRDGFLSAWYADPETTTRPSVSVYSVDAASVNSVYDMAVANGADLIVGPLEKSTVAALAARPELPVRTLALNVADKFTGADPANGLVSEARFFQFALAPEDEAAQAAEKARADGYSRAVTMGPETPWGRRLVTAFAKRWQELGGVILIDASYDADESSYSKSVKQALNIDLSEARALALRRALKRKLEFEPRRRADVEMIFLAGFPLSARQILPQLRYFRAETVPVYSTSHAYSGRPNAAADQDLDGLRFGDMPWLFGAADSDSFAMFTRNWPDRAPESGRLFAFAVDTYRILPYLARMRHQPSLRIPGATGLLHMDADGRVSRDLAWARFDGGVPLLVDQ